VFQSTTTQIATNWQSLLPLCTCEISCDSRMSPTTGQAKASNSPSRMRTVGALFQEKKRLLTR